MYKVSLHKIVCPEENIFPNNSRSEFYLSSSDDVCQLITKLPKGWFIALVQFDLDSPDSIIDEFNF